MSLRPRLSGYSPPPRQIFGPPLSTPLTFFFSLLPLPNLRLCFSFPSCPPLPSLPSPYLSSLFLLLLYFLRYLLLSYLSSLLCSYFSFFLPSSSAANLPLLPSSLPPLLLTFFLPSSLPPLLLPFPSLPPLLLPYLSSLPSPHLTIPPFLVLTLYLLPSLLSRNYISQFLMSPILPSFAFPVMLPLFPACRHIKILLVLRFPLMYWFLNFLPSIPSLQTTPPSPLYALPHHISPSITHTPRTLPSSSVGRKRASHFQHKLHHSAPLSLTPLKARIPHWSAGEEMCGPCWQSRAGHTTLICGKMDW